MSTPNPLAPQGSLLEQQGRSKSTLQIITFIGALHVFFLCGLLWIGCKKDDRLQTSDPLNSPGQPLGGNADPNLASIPLTSQPLSPAPIPSPSPGPIASSPGPSAAPLTVPAPAPAALTTPEATPAPVSGPSVHRVQSREIGSTIAKKHGITLAALKAANPNAKWNALQLNEPLQIPAAEAHPANAGTGALALAPTPGSNPGLTGIAPADGTVYEVKPGDSGIRIARKFGVSWKSIRAANHLSNDVIKPRKKLIIPPRSAGAVVSPIPTTTDAGTAVFPSANPIVTPPTGSSLAPAPGRP